MNDHGARGAWRFVYGWWAGLDEFIRCELFLFSDGDTLVPAAGIEAFAALRRDAHGAATRTVRLERSAHCQHFRTHPEQYERAVAEFIADLPPRCR